MSVPKRRQTSSRRKKRAIHLRLDTKQYVSCKQCGEPVLPHHACKSCGTYAGKKVIATNLDKSTSKTASK